MVTQEANRVAKFQVDNCLLVVDLNDPAIVVDADGRILTIGFHIAVAIRELEICYRCYPCIQVCKSTVKVAKINPS